MTVTMTDHADMRSAQRNVSDEEICFIAEHGYRVRRTGGIFCQLRLKDVPADLPGNHPFRRLVGTTILLFSDGEQVKTVYRGGDRSFKKDRSKSKYCRRRHAWNTA